MFLSRAFGPCARIPSTRPGLHALRPGIVLLSAPPHSAPAPSRARHPSLRPQGATHAASTSSGMRVRYMLQWTKPNFSKVYRFPENLNVFNAGSVPVVTLGTVRIVCLAAFGAGFLYIAPSIIADGGAPWYTGPLIALGSAIPFLLTGVAWGGYVQHINILLPSAARRSKEDLLRFVSNMPPTAIVQIKSMWFRPWPVTQDIFFEDFRRLPQSKIRLANLEWAPQKNAEAADKNPMKNWIAKRLMGTYFVNERQSKDRSRAPGIWKKIWEQIPMAGEAPVKREVVKKPVLPSNRSVVRRIDAKAAREKRISRAPNGTASKPGKSSPPPTKP